MSGVKIVTDSAGDFAPEFLEGKGITVVPLTVHFGTETFRDWYDLRGKQFYDRMRSSDILPRTSQPSPAAFQEAFSEGTADGSRVICITLSSGVSGTYQSALIAKNMLAGKPITVIDSKLASCGFGMLSLLAQEMASNGAGAEEIASEVTAKARKTVSVFSVDTLDYLAKNGRIGRAAHFMGTLLNMKPILGLDAEGYVTALERVRGSSKVIPTLVEQALERAGSNKAAALAVCHADCPDVGRELLKAATAAFDAKQVYESELGPIIGSHVGPGTVALFIQPE